MCGEFSFVDDKGNGGWFLLEFDALWIFRALAQFKRSEGSPGLFQKFEDGYIKVLRLPMIL